MSWSKSEEVTNLEGNIKDLIEVTFRGLLEKCVGVCQEENFPAGSPNSEKSTCRIVKATEG